MDLGTQVQISVIKWIKDIERIEGCMTNVSSIHSSCISIKFKSGKTYKISFSLSSKATLS